jgi:hypothetical protein
VQAIITEYTPEVHAAIEAATASSSSGSSSSRQLLQGKRKRKAVPGPAPAPTAAAAADQTTVAVPQQLDIAAAVGELSLGELVQALLPSSDHSSSSDTSDAGDAASVQLSPAVRTAVKFRVSKKMLLMDVVVAAGVPLAVLQQGQAGSRGSAAGALSTCHALPWQQASSSA